jgi:ER membrane protein complex subunit 1
MFVFLLFIEPIHILMVLQDFPRFLVGFAKRSVTGCYTSTHSIPSSPKGSNSTEPLLSRDTFGFRQITVAGAANGKVFGIDSSSAEIVWGHVFGLGWAGEVGGRVVAVKLFVTKTAADGGDSEVVMVTQRRADNVRLLYAFTSLRQSLYLLSSDFSRHCHLPFEC